MGCCGSKEDENDTANAAQVTTPATTATVAPPEPEKQPTQPPPQQQSPSVPPSPPQPQQPTLSQPPQQSPHSITLEELFKKVNAALVDELIMAMETLLDSLQTKSNERTRGVDIVTPSEADMRTTNSISGWASFVDSGAEILEFVSKQIQPKGGVASQLFDSRQAVAEILEKVGKLHWIAGTLSILAYLLVQIGQVSDNQIECIKLLNQMVKLARHIKALNYNMPEEGKTFRDAILMIFQGSMMCATLLKSKKFFSFLRASVDSTSLRSLRSDISHVYDDMILTVVEKLYHEQPTSRPPLQPMYPDYAVGIEESQNQVMKMLDMTTKKESCLAMVIFGVGGIGKTTLANAVISLLDLKDYNYTGVEILEDCNKNDLKCIQQQILKDVFPKYENGRNLVLRNCAEGRHHLTKAFKCLGNKPVFVFIDNARRPEDLQEILPSDLPNIPHRSRLLVTTRNLGVTDMLQKGRLERRQYHLNALPKEQAKDILLKHVGDQVEVTNEEMDSILQICGGIPLLLEIVGARLHRANSCTQIVEALRRGEEIREENVTNRLFDFVYNQLEESTQQVFLDICCFFTNWSRRHVEYILGAEEVTLLEDAALVKVSTENEVIVHDLIRAIGIRKSEGSRIRDLQSLQEAVKDEVKVKGVWLIREDEAEQTYPLEAALLSSMKMSLRVLSLGSGIKVSERIQKASKFQELRFLLISGDVPCLPLDLEPLERLAVYHGPMCVEGVNIYQLPKKLQALKAAGQCDCTDLSTQSRASQYMEIRNNSSLQELDLQELKNLQSLPDRLDHLTALQILLMDDCGFQVLPEQICRLSSLMELKLTSCKNLTELPSSFGELSSLKQLNLAECTELKKLPESFTQLSSLEILNLERCWKLEGLPSSLGKLKKLSKLSLQSNGLKELPSSFGELSSLTEMKCSCMELQELPDSFKQFPLLAKLDLSCCMKLRSLPPSIEKLRDLEDFNLLGCCMLEKLPSKVVELPGLKKLNLWKCDSLKKLPNARKGKELTIVLPDHLQDRRQ